MSTSSIRNPIAAIPQSKHHNGSTAKLLARTGRALMKRLRLIYDIHGERRQMQNLSDETLRDVGITRAQLNAECSRSLTDLPADRK